MGSLSKMLLASPGALRALLTSNESSKSAPAPVGEPEPVGPAIPKRPPTPVWDTAAKAGADGRIGASLGYAVDSPFSILGELGDLAIYRTRTAPRPGKGGYVKTAKGWVWIPIPDQEGLPGSSGRATD